MLVTVNNKNQKITFHWNNIHAKLFKVEITVAELLFNHNNLTALVHVFSLVGAFRLDF